VELSEVLARIFSRHRLLVTLCLALGLAAGIGLHWSDKPVYEGRARLLVSPSEPTSTAQASAQVDAVRALATGPALVREALASIGVDRDVSKLSRGAISVRGMGGSGVVELRVTDRDPAVAIQLTDAIGQALVKQRTDTLSATITSGMTKITSRIAATQSQIDAVDNELAASVDLAGSADPEVVSRATADRDRLLAQRDGLVQELSVLFTQRADLETQLAQRPATIMVDPASAPATRIGVNRLPDIGLGGLLGLVVGTALAASIETLRPTVVGRAAIARSLQAPVLAEITSSPAGWSAGDVLEAASHTEMAAEGAGITRVEFMSTTPRIDLAGLASALGSELSRLPVGVVNPYSAVTPVTVATESKRPPGPNRARRVPTRPGLVVVVPGAVKLAGLEPVRDFLAISGWPLLGVIIAHRANPLAGRPSPTTNLTSEASA
jgi:capsular polysaccharide biosynthesis protein